MHIVALDYYLIAAYLILMASIGLFFGRFVKDVGGYLKGGNTIPWVVSGISNFMSMFSSFVFVAYAGIAYEYGAVSIIVFWSTIVPCLFAGKFLAAKWRRAELTTPVEYLERRYSFGVRQLYSWTGLFLRFLDNIVRLYASGIFLSVVTPLSIEEAIILSGILITLFTMIGGLWAVTVMDTIQFIILLFATIILVPLSLSAAGGISGIASAFPESMDIFNGPKGAPLWLLAYYLMVILKYNGNWSFIQRIYAVSDEKASRKVAYCTAALFTVTPIIFLTPAIAARVVLPELENPEEAYVAICAYLLPAGMIGLMIASMFGATMSALNSEFNVMAGVLTNDIYKRFIRPKSSEKEQFYFARGATIAVGVCVTIGAMFVGVLGGAFEANKLFTSVFAIPMAVPLIFGLLMRRPNSLSAIIVLLGGFSSALILNLTDVFSWEVSTLITIGICLGGFAVSGVFNKTEKPAAVQFFKQINTPINPDAIPHIDDEFKSALWKLFAYSLFISGGFFIFVSLFAIQDMSGKLAFCSGLLCITTGLFFIKKKKLPLRSVP